MILQGFSQDYLDVRKGACYLQLTDDSTENKIYSIDEDLAFKARSIETMKITVDENTGESLCFNTNINRQYRLDILKMEELNIVEIGKKDGKNIIITQGKDKIEFKPESSSVNQRIGYICYKFGIFDRDIKINQVYKSNSNYYYFSQDRKTLVLVFENSYKVLSPSGLEDFHVESLEEIKYEYKLLDCIVEEFRED